MKNIAHFLFELGMLKRTPRTGFQFLGSGAESVAEHIFRTALIGYTLAQARRPGRSRGGCCCSACSTTFPRPAPATSTTSTRSTCVPTRPRRSTTWPAPCLSATTTAPCTPNSREKRTREALLAHDADQLEMILALKEHKDLGNRYADEWYPFSVQRLQTEVARSLAETIWTTDSSRWWFDGDSDWWVNGERPEPPAT